MQVESNEQDLKGINKWKLSTSNSQPKKNIFEKWKKNKDISTHKSWKNSFISSRPTQQKLTFLLVLVCFYFFKLTYSVSGWLISNSVWLLSPLCRQPNGKSFSSLVAKIIKAHLWIWILALFVIWVSLGKLLNCERLFPYLSNRNNNLFQWRNCNRCGFLCLGCAVLSPTWRCCTPFSPPPQHQPSPLQPSPLSPLCLWLQASTSES